VPQKGAATAGATEPERPPQLQSLLIGPSGRYAIIDGQLVKAGDTVRDARVVAVTPTGVVLSSERGNQTLSLFPNVEKRPPADAGPASARAKSRSAGSETGNNVVKDNK